MASTPTTPTGRPRVQTVVFVGSTALAGLLGIASQALVARELGVGDFAVYAFCLAMLQFTAVLFEFGLFVPASRRAAMASGEERSRIVGSALIAYVPVGLAFGVLILLLALGINTLVDFDARPALMAASIGAFVFPFMLIGQLLAQGTGRLHVSSLASLAWQALFAAALGVLAFAGIAYDSTQAVLLRELAMGFGVLIVCLWLRPRIAGARPRIKALVADAREWGLQVYVGRVLSTGTYNMDILLVGIFAGAEPVALYSLARLLAYSVSLPATGAAGALFTRMTALRELPRRWLELAYGIGFAAALVLALSAEPLIEIAYGESFAAAATLVLPLALAEALRGVCSIYNGFLNAHARGRAIRRTAVVFTVTNLVANFVLIPPFEAEGAAWASLIAMAASVLAYVHAHRRNRPDEPGAA